MLSFLSEIRIKQIFVLVCDALLITASLFISYALRFNTLYLGQHIRQILTILPILLAARLGLFISFGLYRGMWRFVGMRDLVALIQAVTLGSGLTAGLLFMLSRLQGYPRSVFIIEWFVAFVLVGGSRFAFRLYRERWFKPANGSAKSGKKVLIVGAGRAGEMILREILGNYSLDYAPVGFVDDDRHKRNQTIHGYRVLGNTRAIPRLSKQYGIKEIFLAIPSTSGAAKRRIMLTCKSAGVKFKTLPAVGDLLNGRVTIRALRDFQIEDLLGREPARLDTAAIKEYLRGKTVMITGAGGSIGSELCRQVLLFSPKSLVLYERSEFNLYQIQMNLRELHPEADIQPIIGDILNQPRVERTLKQFKPEVVFHAAAYKHVPLMEQHNAWQAVQ